MMYCGRKILFVVCFNGDIVVQESLQLVEVNLSIQ